MAGPSVGRWVGCLVGWSVKVGLLVEGGFLVPRAECLKHDDFEALWGV